jgi:serine protease Do
MKRLLQLVGLISCISLTQGLTQAALPPVTTSIAPMLKTIMPSIVNVRVETNVSLNATQGPQAPANQQPQDNPPMIPGQKAYQLGSGVIVDAQKGYIITNAHVIKNAKTITVTLNDSRELLAKLVGQDPSSDIAVLQIETTHLKAIPLGNSEQLEVGDFVAAIGSPFGLNQTVTAGIISALQRNDLNIEGIENFIQTDAAINPGNSGGALVTFQGKLVGINTAIFTPAGGNVGIGFAIPVNMARSVMEQLIKYGTVHRGLLGIFAQPLTTDLSNALHIPDNLTGTVITSVTPDSPAARSDLRVGDIILSINGQSVKDPFEIRNIIGLLRVGSHIDLKILRRGKVLDKTTIITDSAAQEKAMLENQPFLTGVSLGDLTPIFSSVHGEIAGGVQVLTVNDNATAAKAGLLPGDIIVSANQTSVKSIADLYKAAKLSKKMLLLNVIRGPGALFIVIK